MLKRIIQNLAPSFLLDFYKRRQFFKIVRDYDINDEPDLIVAQKLVDPNSIFVDIGANIGLYTKFISPLVKQVRCFEPVPFTYSMLENNISRLGIENVELNQIAISDKAGEARIDVPIHTGVLNYYRAAISNSAKKSNSGKTVEIKTTTIDTLFLNIPEEISLIKCDVEGHELQVIKGAQQFLEQTKPAWLIEVSDDPDDRNSAAFQLNNLLLKHGYKIYLYEKEVLRQRLKGDNSVNYFYLQDVHLEKLSKSSIVID